MQPIQLIVGLANPGKEYAPTRHNAGAWFVDALAQLAKVHLHLESKYHGLHAVAALHHQACHLLIPTTFMNHNGRSVQSCMNYHKILPQQILIAHDDIDLPVGTIKLKYDGGDGGHNGLKDVIRHLKTKEFYRLRIGIGHPGNSKDVVDYVLKAPSKSEKKEIEKAIERAEEVSPFILKGEMHKAMQHLHTSKD